MSMDCRLQGAYRHALRAPDGSERHPCAPEKGWNSTDRQSQDLAWPDHF